MQRQLRLGDILDDYCPRERRLTNHAVVAMIGEDVRLTRCSTCDAEHEYKHAKVPRQRKKDTPAGLAAQIIASGPKRVSPDPPASVGETPGDTDPGHSDAGDGADIDVARDLAAVQAALGLSGSRRADADRAVPGGDAGDDAEPGDDLDGDDRDDALGNVAGSEPEGPAHRRLIRATLPRLEGQPPASRPAPDFTIRTPTGGRPNRFRARNQGPNQGSNQRGTGGMQPFGGARQGQPGNSSRGGPAQRSGNNRPPQANQSRRFDGRKRSK